MTLVVVDPGLIADLSDLAHIHVCDAITDVSYHEQIGGDEEVRQAELILNVLEEVVHLSLNGNVQHRYCL